VAQGIENEKAEVILSKSAPLALGYTVWQFCLELLQFHKWLAAHFSLLISPFVPDLAHCHNFLPDSILLGSGLMQALVCLVLDPLHVLSESDVWNEDTTSCEIRGARSSLWTLVLSARVALC
jgi:hypothetical protein